MTHFHSRLSARLSCNLSSYLVFISWHLLAAAVFLAQLIKQENKYQAYDLNPPSTRPSAEGV